MLHANFSMHNRCVPVPNTGAICRQKPQTVLHTRTTPLVCHLQWVHTFGSLALGPQSVLWRNCTPSHGGRTLGCLPSGENGNITPLHVATSHCSISSSHNYCALNSLQRNRPGFLRTLTSLFVTEILHHCLSLKF